MSRHVLGWLTARSWDLEMSADVGQQVKVPAERVSSSPRPEQTLQEDTQHSVLLYSVQHDMHHRQVWKKVSPKDSN